MPAVAPIKSIKGQKNKFDEINPIPAMDARIIVFDFSTSVLLNLGFS